MTTVRLLLAAGLAVLVLFGVGRLAAAQRSSQLRPVVSLQTASGAAPVAPVLAPAIAPVLAPAVTVAPTTTLVAARPIVVRVTTTVATMPPGRVARKSLSRHEGATITSLRAVVKLIPPVVCYPGVGCLPPPRTATR